MVSIGDLGCGPSNENLMGTVISRIIWREYTESVILGDYP